MFFRNSIVVLILGISAVSWNKASAQITGDFVVFEQKVNNVVATSYDAGNTLKVRIAGGASSPASSPDTMLRARIEVYDTNCNLIAAPIATTPLAHGTMETISLEYPWTAPNPLNGQNTYYIIVTLYYIDAMDMEVWLATDDAEFNHPTM